MIKVRTLGFYKGMFKKRKRESKKRREQYRFVKFYFVR